MKDIQYDINLPLLSNNGYYEMRFESIGGLGANLCGKILGELGARSFGLNSSSFSSYGSEKRGSAVKTYVRWCKPPRDIMHNSPVESPQLLAIFHEALINSSPLTAGVDDNCVVVVNSEDDPMLLRDKLKLYAGTVCTVDALGISVRTKSRINMVMLGAIARASGFIRPEILEEYIKNSLGKKYPGMIQSNLDGLRNGYENTRVKRFLYDGKYKKIPYIDKEPSWGYLNAPIGGANPHIGSTFSNELSSSREGYIPIFEPEKCIHCGLCDSTCPDMVFQFIPGAYRGKECFINSGLDYHHCKGCLRCVEICPTGALETAKEREYYKKPHFVRNKDLISHDSNFEAAGADASVTGEAYLRETRPDGGQI